MQSAKMKRMKLKKNKQAQINRLQPRQLNASKQMQRLNKAKAKTKVQTDFLKESQWTISKTHTMPQRKRNSTNLAIINNQHWLIRIRKQPRTRIKGQRSLFIRKSPRKLPSAQSLPSHQAKQFQRTIKNRQKPLTISKKKRKQMRAAKMRGTRPKHRKRLSR